MEVTNLRLGSRVLTHVIQNRSALASRACALPSMLHLDPQRTSRLLSNILNDSPRRRSSPSSGYLVPSSSSLAMPRHAWHWVERQIRWSGPCVEKGLFRRICFRPDFSGSSYRQSSRFYSFCVICGSGWCEEVLLYDTRKSVGSSVFFSSDAYLTRNEPSSKQVGGIELGPKPRELRSWRCTKPRAAKARTARVAVVGEMSSLPRTAAIFHRMIHVADGRVQECATLTCGEKQQQ